MYQLKNIYLAGIFVQSANSNEDQRPEDRIWLSQDCVPVY